MVKIVGILNITPDSFSDGNKFNSLETAKIQLQKLITDGADIIDIGAESTRPNATPISATEEWHRLEEILPICIKIIKQQKKNIQISLDTRNVQTARKAYAFGVSMVNDVSGLQNLEMIHFLAGNSIKTVLMHSLSVPADPKIVIADDLDVINEIIAWVQEKLAFLLKNGFNKQQLIFDPGIGFGKNATQSIEILRRIDELRALNLPLYIGHSKKSFLDQLTFERLKEFDFKVENYDEKSFNSLNKSQKTAVISSYLQQKGVEFIRIHDIS